MDTANAYDVKGPGEPSLRHSPQDASPFKPFSLHGRPLQAIEFVPIQQLIRRLTEYSSPHPYYGVRNRGHRAMAVVDDGYALFRSLHS